MPRIALGLAIAVIIGCGGGSGGGSTSLPDPLVKAINASSDSTALDVVLNETVIANNLGYLQAVAGYSTVAPGDYDVLSMEDGVPETQTAEAFVFSSDRSYLVVASGLASVANPDLEKRLRTTIIQVDRNAPNGNKARLVIFHAYNRAVGLQTPNLDFQNPGNTPQFAVKDIGFAGGSIRDIDSGMQTFVARRSETEFEVTPQVTFDFLPGKIYIAIIAGQEDDLNHPPAISIIQI